MVSNLSSEDGAATLVAISVEAVVKALVHCPVMPERILVSGGGRLNQTMMAALESRLSSRVEAVESAGLDGDMLEAQAFAHLAARVDNHLPTSAPGTTGVAAAIAGGIKSGG